MINLPRLEESRANHFVYGFVVYLISTIFVSNLFAFIIVMFVALLKELWDEYKYKSGNLIDAICTVIPALLLIIKNYIQ